MKYDPVSLVHVDTAHLQEIGLAHTHNRPAAEKVRLLFVTGNPCYLLGEADGSSSMRLGRTSL